MNRKSLFRDYDQVALDAQYNCRAAVPEHVGFLARWPEASIAARSQLDGVLDTPYGTHPRARLDIFPAAVMPSPVLVFIHGGYWQTLDKNDFSWIAPPFVAAGVSVVLVRYPLAPQDDMDSIVGCVHQALRWVGEHVVEFGGDPERVFIAGHSAGAHLTATALLAGGYRYPLLGGCAISGIYELEPIRCSYLNEVVGLNEHQVNRHSPIRDTATGTPLILAVGSDETDEFLRQHRDYQRTRTDAGDSVTALELPGYHHFSVVEVLADTEGPLFPRIMERLSP